MVWLYCQVNSISPALTVTWTKDSVTLVPDVPHTYARPSFSDATSSTFALIINDFGVSDSGVYQCVAENEGNTAMGTSLTLTG